MKDSRSPVKYVIGPDGHPMTAKDLPPANTRSWTVMQQAKVVTAVRSGLISSDGACGRYGLTVQELEGWQEMLKDGISAFRTRKIENSEHVHPSSNTAPRGGVDSLNALSGILQALLECGLSLFINDIRKDGFGPNSKREAKAIWIVFEGCIAQTKRSSLADEPWKLMRKLANSICYDGYSESDVAKILLVDLKTYAAAIQASKYVHLLLESAVQTISGESDLHRIHAYMLQQKYSEALKLAEASTDARHRSYILEAKNRLYVLEVFKSIRLAAGLVLICALAAAAVIRSSDIKSLIIKFLQ